MKNPTFEINEILRIIWSIAKSEAVTDTVWMENELSCTVADALALMAVRIATQANWSPERMETLDDALELACAGKKLITII